MTVEEKLKEAFRLLKEVVDETGINLIDNLFVEIIIK